MVSFMVRGLGRATLLVVAYGTVAAGRESLFVASLAMNTQGNPGDFILSNLRGLKLA